MFNILPENIKKKIQTVYTTRLIVVWLLAIFCVEISYIVFVMPSYVSLTYEQKSLASEIVPVDQSGTDSTSLITAANAEMVALSHHLTVPMHTIINTIAALEGHDVSLTDVTYEFQTASSSTITLQGTAVSRDSLLSFAKRLEASPYFSNVNLPVSTFAKDSNIAFSLSVNALTTSSQ